MFCINVKDFYGFLLTVPFNIDEGNSIAEVEVVEEEGSKTCDGKKHEIKMQQTAGENNKME